MKFLLLTAVLALTHLQVYGQDDYCYGKDEEKTQTRHFTSKTAYEIIKSGSNIERTYKVPGCEPHKIWILHRHGTRLPGKHTIRKASTRLEELRKAIVENYQKRRRSDTPQALCDVDLKTIQMWHWNSSITEDKANYLTSQGYEDLRSTARLYQRLFPEVLTKQYTETGYLFRHTDTQRTEESFKAFTEALFGGNADVHAEPQPEKDFLLRPYDYCEPWNNLDYTSPSSENYKYRHSELWNRTIADISRRLGFDYPLESDDVELMYDICRYDLAWHPSRISAWCAAFLPSQVTVFEYEDDMKYFYKSGYGNEENERLMCRGVQDMLSNLKSHDEPNVVVNFAHSAGVQTFITALGINKDELKLTATNYDQLKDRRWMTSNIDPFAANFLAVKYQCPADPTEQEKVVFFLNQNTVQLEWCEVGLCSWAEVQKRYASIQKADCSSYYCGGAAGLSASLAALLVAAIGYLIY